MMKMLLWIIVARVVNYFPGGDHFLLWNNNNKKKKKLKISSSSISSDNDNDNDSSNEINNDGNISSAAWASRKATKIRQHSGEKLAPFWKVKKEKPPNQQQITSTNPTWIPTQKPTQQPKTNQLKFKSNKE